MFKLIVFKSGMKFNPSDIIKRTSQISEVFIIYSLRLLLCGRIFFFMLKLVSRKLIRRILMINVAAAILERNNKILIARRPIGDSLAGYWEFPGGKIEDGETSEQCLRREIDEELGLIINVNTFFCESKYEYPNKCITLKAYFCEWVSGEPQLNVHDRIEWVSYSELGNYNFAPADIPISEKLARHGGWINATGICDHYCG